MLDIVTRWIAEKALCGMVARHAGKTHFRPDGGALGAGAEIDINRERAAGQGGTFN